MTTQELTEDSDVLVVYHLHGQIDRSMIWANGTQNSGLVNFDSESLLPLFCTNQYHLPENDHEGLKLILKKALKKWNTNFRYLEYSVRKNRGAFHSTKTLENLETAANGTEIAFFHLLRILVPGYWQGKSYFKKTMKLKDIKRRTMIEIISHNTSVLFSLLFNWSFIAIKMNLFLSFLQQQEEIFYFFLFVAI